MAIFYLIMSVILFCMQLISWAWLLRCFPGLGWKIPFYTSSCLTLVMLFGLTYTHTHYTGLFSSVLYYLAYICFGLIFLSFCFCIILTVLGKILTWCHLPTGWMGVATLVTLAVVWGLSFWGGFSAPQLKRIQVRIPGAPAMKLALLSDTHLGMGVSVKRFEKVMQRIEAQKPDALLLLGDIFEYGPNRSAYAKRIKEAVTPLGTYGVFGNHEYYVGYENSKDFFKQAGITLLENSSALLPNGVQIAGLKDIRTAHVQAQDVARLLDGLNQQQTIILLSHTPLLAQTAAAHGADVMVSGHTHNGQLWPFNYLVKLQFPQSYGLFDIGDMKFYITSGVFYWGIPLRFLAPSEIVIVEVLPA